MKRLLGYLTMAALLCVLPSAQARPGFGGDDEVSTLRREVHTLKVLKDLNLSQDQLKQLHDLAVKATQLRQTFEQSDKGQRDEELAALNARKEELLSGKA